MSLFIDGSGVRESFSNLDGRICKQVEISGKVLTSQQLNKSGMDASWENWWLNFIKGAVTFPLLPSKPTLSVVDLFASAGGLSVGVREAAKALNIEFKSVAAVDLDVDALATYGANFKPETLINDSVRTLVDYFISQEKSQFKFDKLPQLVGQARSFQSVDMVIGGPPCQGHSSLNNHTRGNDVRNNLYLSVPAIAVASEANFVIIENVPRVVHDSQKVVQTAYDLLSNAGYFVTMGTLNAAQLGWPQSRSRHFMIASRLGQPIEISRVIEMYRRPSQSLWWLIHDLESIFDADNLFLSVPKISKENKERIDWLFDNEAYELPNHIRPDCHKDGHSYPSVYGRLSKDAASPTLTTGFQSPGRGRYIHPTQRRVLTIREAARIQGFPDSYKFAAAEGNLTRGMLQKWIGDAVPSPLGYVAAMSALGSIQS